jgi:hypothetical protein
MQGEADIAIQLASEIMSVEGVKIAAPLLGGFRNQERLCGG